MFDRTKTKHYVREFQKLMRMKREAEIGKGGGKSKRSVQHLRRQ